MPKLDNTRKLRAAKLLRMLEDGPTFSPLSLTCDQTGRKPFEIYSEDYRRWAQSWIIDELKYLVPELKDANK